MIKFNKLGAPVLEVYIRDEEGNKIPYYLTPYKNNRFRVSTDREGVKLVSESEKVGFGNIIQDSAKLYCYGNIMYDMFQSDVDRTQIGVAESLLRGYACQALWRASAQCSDADVTDIAKATRIFIVHEMKMTKTNTQADIAWYNEKIKEAFK